MIRKSLTTALLAVSVVSLAACTPTSLPSSPNPSASPEPSAEASAEPNAEQPGEDSTLPNDDSSPDPSSSTEPDAEASETPAASAGGKLSVSGSEVFNQYSMDFHPGMTWVYKMSTEVAVPNISVPSGLPAGVTIPNFGVQDTMDLGTMTMEVISVSGNMVTIRTTVDASGASPAPIQPSESTFDKSKGMASFYSEQIGAGMEGTLSWSKGSAGASVSVAAGTYTADMILGKMHVTANADGTSADLDQDIQLWMKSGEGMIKEEVKSTIESSGVNVDSTTTIELQSFKG